MQIVCTRKTIFPGGAIVKEKARIDDLDEAGMLLASGAARIECTPAEFVALATKDNATEAETKLVELAADYADNADVLVAAYSAATDTALPGAAAPPSPVIAREYESDSDNTDD